MFYIVDSSHMMFIQLGVFSLLIKGKHVMIYNIRTTSWKLSSICILRGEKSCRKVQKGSLGIDEG